MTEKGEGEAVLEEVLKQWRGRFIGDREGQHLQELIRREAAGEFSAEEMSTEVRRVLLQLFSHEQGSD